MKRRTKYYLISLLVLVIFIIAYHFYAARQAEIQIDETIQEQKAKTVSVTYTSVNVAPFGGDIRFDGFSIVDSSGIYRSRSILLDMAYGDFLNIYFRGLKYGLEHLTHTVLVADQPSYISRSLRREVKFNALNMTIEGNAWDVLVSLVNSATLKTPLSLRLDGETFTYHMPGSLPGTIRADTVSSEHFFPARNRILEQPGEHRLMLKQIIWTPPLSFQKQYGFFMRGFDYKTDRVPADSLHFFLTSASADSNVLSLGLFTELFDAEATSLLIIDEQSPADSRLKNGTVKVHNASEQFEIFIKNLEQLLGKKLSGQSNEILRFSGPLSNPRFTVEQ